MSEEQFPNDILVIIINQIGLVFTIDNLEDSIQSIIDKNIVNFKELYSQIQKEKMHELPTHPIILLNRLNKGNLCIMPTSFKERLTIINTQNKVNTLKSVVEKSPINTDINVRTLLLQDKVDTNFAAISHIEW